MRMEDSFLLDLMELLRKPSVMETFVDIVLCAVPIWLAVMIGLVIGWSWRPRWTGLLYLGLRSKFRFIWTLPPGLGARRLWLAFTALSAFSVARRLWYSCRGKRNRSSSAPPVPESSSEEGNSGNTEREQDVITGNDLEHLWRFIEGKAGDMAWQTVMERSTSNFYYQAWRHEPVTGPTVYRSRSVFEDVSPELVRDFFWDDEFRPKWDPMLSYFKILEECPHSGTMVVHWIRKFPFFCSDREYIIGRRIWEAGKTYYCVTKGVPYPGMKPCPKPRRVNIYFSSWSIRGVESRKGDGQLSACEVNLVHYEDMGIPNDVAKLGVRHGMWGTVKKLHSGLRAYQNARKSEASLSRYALMARITTKISFDESADVTERDATGQTVSVRRRKDHGIDWKWVAVGGALALVCGLQTGTIGKTLLFGAAQRLARR